MTKTIIIIFILFLLCANPSFPILDASSTSFKSYSNFEKTEDCKSHIIEGVPYVSQETKFCCFFASAAMIFQYYGINTTLKEVLYYSGGGYSLGYIRNRIFWVPFYDVSYMPDDMNFLAFLYGLSYEFWRPQVIVEPLCWNVYWEKIKQYVIKDIPVEIAVDLCTMPYYEGVYESNARGLHCIVIVGFDENKEIVYYNDPAAALFTKPEDGLYANMSMGTLRKASYRAFFEMKLPIVKYYIWTYEKISDPLPKNIAMDLAYKRNIERMSGNPSSYDKEFRKPYYDFGIQALKSYKKNIDSINVAKILMLYKISDIFSLSVRFRTELENRVYVEKHNISQFLLKNSNLSSIYRRDALLLEKESQYWKQLHLLNKKLYLTIADNKLPKAILLSKNIIEDMVDVVDNIIIIQEFILDSYTNS